MQKTKRPIATTFLLIIIALIVLSSAMTFFKSILTLVSLNLDIPPFEIFVSFARFILGVGILSFTFWAILKRKPFGRWAGVVFVLILFIGSTYLQFFVDPSKRMFQRLEYNNPTLGNQIEFLFKTLTFGFWIYCLGFSTKARLYYDQNYLNTLEQEKVLREQREKNRSNSNTPLS